MKCDLVVARYNENIEWINKVAHLFNKVYLYNKGTQIKMSLKSNVLIYVLPNHGRESNTYLTHIINNYNTLGDRIIFTQANPFDHSPDFIKLMSLWKKFDKIQPLTLCYSMPHKFNKMNYDEKYRYYGTPPHYFTLKSNIQF